MESPDYTNDPPACSFPSYDSANMKRWLLFIGAFAGVALITFGVCHALEERAQRRREIEYDSSLRSYSQDLRPRMKRKEVEDDLSAKSIPFLHMCCVKRKELNRFVYDDLVKIGHEDAPWFCSENNIYIAFQFDGPSRSAGATTDPSDTLDAVTLYRWLEGCL